MAAHGLPAYPGEIETGHRVLSYFSSLSGKTIPLRFERDGQSIDVDAASSVAVNESTAHVTALLAGLGIAQSFRFAPQRHLDTGNWYRCCRNGPSRRTRCM